MIMTITIIFILCILPVGSGPTNDVWALGRCSDHRGILFWDGRRGELFDRHKDPLIIIKEGFTMFKMFTEYSWVNVINSPLSQAKLSWLPGGEPWEKHHDHRRPWRLPRDWSRLAWRSIPRYTGCPWSQGIPILTYDVSWTQKMPFEPKVFLRCLKKEAFLFVIDLGLKDAQLKRMSLIQKHSLSCSLFFVCQFEVMIYLDISKDLFCASFRGFRLLFIKCKNSCPLNFMSCLLRNPRMLVFSKLHQSQLILGRFANLLLLVVLRWPFDLIPPICFS